MKKNLIIGGMGLLILIFIFIVFSLKTGIEKSVKQYHFATVLLTSHNITCTYPQVLYTNYSGGKITHELPSPEANPIIITFSDMLNEVVKIKFIDSTQTISEVNAVKVLDMTEKLILIEGNGNPYMTIHTIYKNIGVATYAKSASLLGTPIGIISMGTCVGY